MSSIVIVGDGVVGLSLGVKLKVAGHDVAVVGPGTRIGGASQAAGAMLGVYAEMTGYSQGTTAGQVKHSFSRSAHDLWPEWLSLLAKDGDSTAQCADGTFVILNSVGTHAVDTVNYNAIRAGLENDGVPWEYVDPQDIPGLSPNELSRPLSSLYIPSENAVNASLLLEHLEAKFADIGGNRDYVNVRGLDTKQSSAAPKVLLADGRVLSGDVTILAAGAFTQEMLDLFPDVAARIPRLVAGYGVSAVVESREPHDFTSVVRTPNRAFACGLHVVPRGRTSAYLGGTNILSVKPRVSPLLEDVQFLLDCATQQLAAHLSHASLNAVQVGNRPIPLDGLPIVGWSGVEGLYLATGTYRDGLTISPHLADLVVSEIEQGRTPDALLPFTPQRPPSVEESRISIVNEAVDHMMATGYEHDWTVPNDWFGRVRALLTREFQEWADGLHSTYTPPPEILAGLTTRPDLRHAVVEYYESWS